MTNPIWKALLSLMLQGKEVLHVQPNPLSAYPRKRIIFHFEDGTQYEVAMPADRKQFVDWWDDAATRFKVTFADEKLN